MMLTNALDPTYNLGQAHVTQRKYIIGISGQFEHTYVTPKCLQQRVLAVGAA